MRQVSFQLKEMVVIKKTPHNLSFHRIKFAPLPYANFPGELFVGHSRKDVTRLSWKERTKFYY